MATILVLNGASQGEWYTIPQNRPLLIGRDDTLLAGVRDPRVSRRHMEIRFDEREQRYYAVDLHSRNGITVNGQRAQGFRALNDQDVVQLGHTVLAFTLTDFDDDDDAQTHLKTYEHAHRELLDEVLAHEQGDSKRGRKGELQPSGVFGFNFFRWRR